MKNYHDSATLTPTRLRERMLVNPPVVSLGALTAPEQIERQYKILRELYFSCISRPSFLTFFIIHYP